MDEEKKTEYQESMKFGALRELSALKIFIEQGFTVSIPNINARYDFIAEKYPALIRVQVKNLILKKGDTNEEASHLTWCIRPYSMAYGKKRTYDHDDCDLVVGINLDVGTFAIVPISELIGKTEFRLSTHKDSKGKNYLDSFKAIEEFIELHKKKLIQDN